MSTPTRRSGDVPDPSESRERARPEKEAGLGKMHETRNTPVPSPQPDHSRSRDQSEKRRGLNADDLTDQSEAVEPARPAPAGGQADPGKTRDRRPPG